MNKSIKKFVSKVLAFALIGGLAFSPMGVSATKSDATKEESQITKVDTTKKAADFNSETKSEYVLIKYGKELKGNNISNSTLSFGKNIEATMKTFAVFDGESCVVRGTLQVPVSYDSCSVYVANINAKKLTYKKVENKISPETGVPYFEYTIKNPFKNKTTGLKIDHLLGIVGHSADGTRIYTSYYLGGYVVKVVCKKNGKVYTTKSVSPIIATSQVKGYTYNYIGKTESANKHSYITNCYIHPKKGKSENFNTTP
jgi:hypothetical protein